MLLIWARFCSSGVRFVPLYTQPPHSPIAPPERAEFLWNVHSYLCEQIRFADTKAALVIGWSSVVIGFAISKDIHRQVVTANWAAVQTSTFDLLLVATRAGSLFALAMSFVLAVFVVRPRLSDHSATGYIFWRRILNHRSPELFHESLLSRTGDEIDRHVSDHIFTLSQICEAKYRRLVWATRTAFWGTILGTIVLLMTR